MTSTADDLVAEYLAQLRAELADLPRARRRELEQEIGEHIAEARAELASETEADVRTLLDRLGDPADIAAEARERLDLRPRSSRTLEVATLVLLLIGGIVVPAVGWLVGVVLLWISDVWTTRDKLLGTFVVPGGLALPIVLISFPAYSEVCVETSTSGVTCSGGPSDIVQVLGIVVVVVLLVAPLVTTAYLARRLRRRSIPATA